MANLPGRAIGGIKASECSTAVEDQVTNDQQNEPIGRDGVARKNPPPRGLGFRLRRLLVTLAPIVLAAVAVLEWLGWAP
jgi:hypothetical protein